MTADPSTLRSRSAATRPRLAGLGLVASTATFAIAVGVAASAWAGSGGAVAVAIASTVVAVAAMAAFGCRRRMVNGAPVAANDGSPADIPQPLQPLQQQVLPVWRSHVEAARELADGSVGKLLERFTSLSGQLDAALDAPASGTGTSAGAGTVEAAAVGRSPEIDRLRDVMRGMQADVDQILVDLQSQDRLHQMLGSVCDDMGRMEAWLGGADDEAARQPQQWLARLEASYTMEEMRTTHHGSAAVERQAGVEFF